MSGQENPSLKRGCLMGMIVLLLLTFGLILMWWQVTEKFVPPPELKPYASRDSALARIESKRKVADSTRLDSSDVEFYVQSLDSINIGWGHFTRAWDTTLGTHEKADEEFDPLDLDELGVVFWRLPLYARRGLTNYLNERDRSWYEYQWAKRRVIAASGISQDELADSLYSLLKRYRFDIDEESRETRSEQTARELFDEVEAIREKGIDSAERAIVQPYRHLLLTEGLHSLTDAERMFYGEK